MNGLLSSLTQAQISKETLTLTVTRYTFFQSVSSCTSQNPSKGLLIWVFNNNYNPFVEVYTCNGSLTLWNWKRVFEYVSELEITFIWLSPAFTTKKVSTSSNWSTHFLNLSIQLYVAGYSNWITHMYQKW